MPISSNDFEKSDRDPSIVLMDFLRTNPRVAFGMDELVGMLASVGRDLPREEVERMISLFEYGGRVESRAIAGETYYRYRGFSYSRPPTKPKK